MNREADLPHLGPLEQQVMNLLWESCEQRDTPLPIRAVVERMPDLAYTTLATVLRNLHRKGMVEELRDAPVLRYRPRRGRAQHVAWVMGQMLAGAHDRKRCLETFLEELDPADVQSLRELLAERLQ